MENANEYNSGKKRKTNYKKGKREYYNNKFRLMIERIFSPNVQIFKALCTYCNILMKADVSAETRL